MKYLIFILITTSFVWGQENPFEDDYTFYGRKEPLSLSTAFSALGSGPAPLNPADIAFRTDNRLSIGAAVSGSGYGYQVVWMAPNFSLYNAQQTSITDTYFERHLEKNLMQFSFGFSTLDLGFGDQTAVASFGLNLKQQADYYTVEGRRLNGGNALAADLGIVLKWKWLLLDLVVQDLNSPVMGSTEYSYNQGYLIGARYQNDKGLIVALQSLSGPRYANMDFGLNLAAEQSFFEQRLIARFQLTSYFNGPQAVMQNIAGGIAYRLSSKGRLWTVLKDLEFSYTLSFLTLPHNIGTHMLVLTKYF